MKKKWSQKHEACVQCGLSAHKHVGHGLCKPCWHADWSAKHPGHIEHYKHQWYLSQGGSLLSKLNREQRHYGGKRTTVMKRDKFKCRHCGSPYRLVVHHEDGNGRGSKSPNNELLNLITLCRKCHLKEHRQVLQKARGFIGNAAWSPKYGLAACKHCGRSDRKHNAKGLCSLCYSRKLA